MIKYFILALLVIGSLAGGSQVLLSNLLKTSVSIENKALVRNALNTLKQRAVTVSGLYYLPYGENERGIHMLPSSFIGARNDANGKPLVYCPYAQTPNVAATNTVDTGNTTSYAVTVSTTVVPGGVAYVTHSVPAPISGLAAALIVPKRESVLPSCSDIELAPNGALTLGGDSEGMGTVHALTFDELVAVNQPILYYSVRTSAELLPALQDAAARANMDAVFTLTGGVSFSMNQLVTLSSTSTEFRRKLIFKSSSASQRATINPSSGAELQINDALVSFTGIDFGANGVIRLARSQATFSAASIPVVNAVDSQLTSNGVSWGRNGQSSVPITLTGSSVKQRGADSIRGASSMLVSMQDSVWNTSANLSLTYTGSPTVFQLRNSEFSMSNATLASSGAGNVVLYGDTSSKIRLNTATWTNSGALSYGVVSYGKLDMYNTAFRGNSQVNVAVLTQPGALTHMDNSIIGTASGRPAVGWRDGGSAALSGSAQVYATTCKDGGRFNLTDSTYSVTASDRFATRTSTATGLVIQYVTNPQTIAVDVDGFFAPLTLSCL